MRGSSSPPLVHLLRLIFIFFWDVSDSLSCTSLQPAAVEPTPARLEEQKWNNVANMANQEATVAKPVAATPTDDQVLLNKIEDMYANSDDKTRAIMDDRFKDAMNKSIQ